jgi:hypothetical protein
MKRWQWRSLIDWDSGAGAIAAIGMLGLARSQPAVFHTAGAGIFSTEAVIAAAILAVVLATLTIIATFLTEEYLIVLDHAPTGVAGAFFPYRVIAVISTMALLMALVGSIVWLLPGGIETLAQLYLAITTGLTVWSVVGAVQLVFLTADHGIERANLELILHQKKSEARKRVS